MSILIIQYNMSSLQQKITGPSKTQNKYKTNLKSLKRQRKLQNQTQYDIDVGVIKHQCKL